MLKVWGVGSSVKRHQSFSDTFRTSHTGKTLYIQVSSLQSQGQMSAHAIGYYSVKKMGGGMVFIGVVHSSELDKGEILEKQDQSQYGWVEE